MRIIYMGSGELACPSLEALLDSARHEVVAVVSQPDRPKGRKLQVAACPAKAMAEEKGVLVLAPEKVGKDESVQEIAELKPDIIVVAAYGQYISSKILDLPPYGAINLHPSLLPKYRGAAPIQMAIADGLTMTGVTILYVSKEMDAGDIILQEEYPIEPDDTTASLKPRLAAFGAELVLKAIDLIEEGKSERRPQDEAQATYVHKLTKEDGRIDWSMPARQIANRVRGFYPWPCCHCEVAGKHLKVITACVEDGEGEPGKILSVEGNGPLVAAGEGALRLLEVQPEGKKAMNGKAFLCGHSMREGDRLQG